MFVDVLDDTQEVNPYEFPETLIVQASIRTRVTLGVDNEIPVLPTSKTKEHKLYRVVPTGSAALGSWTYKFYYEEGPKYKPPYDDIPAIFVVTLMYDDFTEGHWGLIMGELNFEMRFTVPRELARVWDRMLWPPQRRSKRRVRG